MSLAQRVLDLASTIGTWGKGIDARLDTLEAGGGGGGGLPPAYGQDQYDLDQLEASTRALLLQRNGEALERDRAADVYNEDWSDLSGWVGTGTVSGGKYHANGAATAGVVRAVNLGATERMVMRFKFRHNNTSGSFIYFGVTNTALGVAPTGGNDTKGVYFGISNTNQMSRFRGSELTGTDPPYSTGALATGEYLMTMVVDETWITWSLSALDYTVAGNQDFAYLRVRRAALPGGPTINNLSVITGGSASTAAGFAAWEGQIVRGSSHLDPATLPTSLAGCPVQYQIEDDTTSIRWMVQVPRGYRADNPAPVVLFMHGAGENGRQPWTDTKTRTLATALEAAGYIIVASDNGTTEPGGTSTDVNKFGNQASMDDYKKLVDYTRSIYATGPVMLLAESMGTFSGLNLLHHRKLGGIAAFASVCGQPNLAPAYADPTWQSEVIASWAYPSANQAAWDAWMVNYNPEQQPGYKFRGIGIKFYVVDDDAVANPTWPGLWATENAGWFDYEEDHTATGGHMAAGAYKPADMLAFYERYRATWWLSDVDDDLTARLLMRAPGTSLVDGMMWYDPDDVSYAPPADSIKPYQPNLWTATQTFSATTAAQVAKVLKGLTGQTADLQQNQDSTGAVLSAINSLGQYLEGGRRLAPLTSRLSSTATSTATAYASTGMSVALTAGKVYKIEVRGQYRTAATTTGIGLRLGGTATATGVRYETTIFGLTATTYTHQAQSALNAAAAASTGVLAANTDYGFRIEGEIRVNAAGTLTVDFITEVAASMVTIQPDAYLICTEVA